jgi:hypothetical protein
VFVPDQLFQANIIFTSKTKNLPLDCSTWIGSSKLWRFGQALVGSDYLGQARLSSSGLCGALLGFGKLSKLC